MPVRDITIVSNPDPTTGLYRDALLLRTVLKAAYPAARVRLLSYREFHAPPADLQIFLEHLTYELVR